MMQSPTAPDVRFQAAMTAAQARAIMVLDGNRMAGVGLCQIRIERGSNQSQVGPSRFLDCDAPAIDAHETRGHERPQLIEFGLERHRPAIEVNLCGTINIARQVTHQVRNDAGPDAVVAGQFDASHGRKPPRQDGARVAAGIRCVLYEALRKLADG
jgi:hypothetical protein